MSCKDFSLNLPLNTVSFGQVSTLILRELYKRDSNKVLPIFPMGGTIDFSSQEVNQEFMEWVTRGVDQSHAIHSSQNPCFKLWHLNGGLESPSRSLNLLTFYELDEPTKHEINVVKNCDKVLFTNKYTQKVFESSGVKSNVVPLAFDNYNFSKLDKRFFDDDRIVFNLCGKFEKRKNHKKIISSWVKKFGNNRKYFLQCAIFNPFISEEQNKQLFAEAVGSTHYFNVQFLGSMKENKLYNDFLNSGNIVIGMSGGEGWGLPEFQSVGIGKYAVIMNATGYQEWANADNSVLVEPAGKIDSSDGMFFKKGTPFNQGRIYDFNEDDFISGCEEAIKKVEKNIINQEGVKLQEKFTASKMVDSILGVLT